MAGSAREKKGDRQENAAEEKRQNISTIIPRERSLALVPTANTLKLVNTLRLDKQLKDSARERGGR